MSDTKRVIIGSETDDTKKIDLKTNGLVVTVPVSLYDSSGSQINLTSGLITAPYNSITLTYDGSNNLTSALYKLSGVNVNTLTMTYDGSGNLLTVTKT